MKKIIVSLLVYLLLLSSILGAVSSEQQSIKVFNELNPNRGYTHTVFLEVGTSQNCKPCHDWNQNIYDAYVSGEYDFQYVEMIEFDHDGYILNDKVNDWAQYYNIGSYPTTICDGDYQRIIGDHPELLQDASENCGFREVAEISAGISVSWLGSGAILVDITIENNENKPYNGHIRTCITEIISRYDTYYGDPYHFGFLDYAFDEDIYISSGGLYTDSVIWDGNEHQDNHGDDFGDIDPDNIQVTLGVINNDNNFVDETVMARVGINNPPSEPGNPSPSNGAVKVDVNADLSWSCSDPNGDPIKYDIYFGTSNPPPQIVWNQSGKSYNPGTMNHKTRYYWKIVAWDSHDFPTSGLIWSFTTTEKERIPPQIKIIKPERALYINNQKILPRPFRLPLIIGDITIEAYVTNGNSAIEDVQFFINGRLMGNDSTEPYTFYWTRDRLRFIHTFLITAVANDEDGAQSVKRMFVKKYL